MTAIRPSDARIGCREAANDNDGLMGCDVAPPNRQAQKRGHQFVIALMLLAGVAALVAGLSEGLQGAATAFPDGNALLQAQAWGRFIEALGQVGTIGLIAIAAALALRWLVRRRRA